jgi:hypothetical protein
MHALPAQGPLQRRQARCSVRASGNMSKWVSDLRADCPKPNAAQQHERCDLICGMGKSVITGPLISDLLGGSGRFTLCDAAGRAQDRRAVWRQSRYGAAPAVCSDSACGRSGAGRSPGSPMVWNRNRTLLLDRPAQLRRALAGPWRPSVDCDLPQPDGSYFELHWGRRFVGAAGPISAASRDVFQPDIDRSWARISPWSSRPRPFGPSYRLQSSMWDGQPR